MNKLSITAAAAALLTFPVYAENYQAEIGVFQQRLELEFKFEGEYDIFNSKEKNTYTSIFAEVYFEQVDTSKGPLAEASFLSKSSGLSIAATTSDEDESSDSWALDGRYVLNSGYILKAAYDNEQELDTWELGFGTYIGDTSDLVVYYANSGGDLDTYAADFHSFIKLKGSSSLAYSLGIAYQSEFRLTIGDGVPSPKGSGDSALSLSGNLTYYFNQNFGLGAGFTKESTDEYGITTPFAYVDWFVTGSLNLGLLYTHYIFDFEMEEDEPIDNTDDEYIFIEPDLDISGKAVTAFISYRF